jgi:rRNA maturation endonuclease Nob1
MLCTQAILSPFAQKFESDDLAAAAVAEDLEEDTREAREDTSVELEADEVAPEVAASDAAAVTETEAEANLDGRLPELTSAEASFSRVALTKVCCVFGYHWLHADML